MFPQFDQIVGAVPEHDRYLGLDELEAWADGFAAAHPAVGAWQAGCSRDGHPIRCLEIPGGASQALLVGMPHPEEPVGTLVLQHLLPLLADGLADELGFGFSVVLAGDPDGMCLNEPWFAEPHDLAGFLLRSYRPATHEQFEWTFPVEYKRYGFTKPLPEARAVMEVIGRRPLDLYMGLHNSNFSGAYVYVSYDDVRLLGELEAIFAASGLPPHCGEPEMPYLRTLADGVFAAFSLADDYEYYQTYGSDPAVLLTGGTSSDDYAETMWGCFTLVAEVPYWTSDRIADHHPAGLTRREAKLRGLETRQQYATWLHERYVEAAAHLTRESPWQRSLHAYLSTLKDDLRAERKLTETATEFAEEATVAQLFDSVYLCELDLLTRVGHFANMVSVEPQQNEVLERLRAEAVDKVRDRAPRLASAGGLEPVPIRTLVQFQLASLLCSLVAVRDRYRPAHPRPAAPRVPGA